ncbi:hypothetical protein MN116_000779 [Schistosoma mekongi]|uniref:NOL1/NOP2/Sun domain family member 4 n=1 Tax=Schistosoma mekongi TaxID=38744 RepID=A0AAE1ZJZ9_SCHME|nr:hypothetical protein MN116_000779 [Schistosoma mekongi]
MLVKGTSIFKFLKPIGLRQVVTLIKKYPRKVPSLLLAEGILPKLTTNDMVYEEIKSEKDESQCINVLLTENIPGLGSIGTITPVHRNRFWRYLYIRGLAELPTEERISEMKRKQSERPRVLCGESYVLQQRLSNMTLYVPMNSSRDWTLNKTHIRVALRRYGISVKEDCISLPKENITSKIATCPFKISVNIDNTVTVDVPCSIFLYQKLDKKSINNIHRFLSYIRRQAYEPIKIEQIKSSDVKFTLSDLSINSKAALAHFDYYYTEAYGPVAWRSMRVALLMPPKQALLYNRYFPDATTTVPPSSLQTSFLPNINVIQTLIEHQNTRVDDRFDAEQNSSIIDEVANVTQSNSPRRQYLTRYSPPNEDINTTNLNEFIPSTELISEQEIYTRECDTDFTYYSKDYYGITKDEFEEENNVETGLHSIKILTEKQFRIPDKLCIKCSPPGRLVATPDPIYTNEQFNVLSVDLGSVVTILALNLQKNDNMLNMSTFSGTKSVIALQTGLLNRLLCVVRYVSRTAHIHQMISSFKSIDHNSSEEGKTATKVDTICLNDLTSYFTVNIDSEYKFNKILVNVPCSADRYAINSGAFHVFGPGQTQLRTNLPRNQLNLLRQAVKLCQPGGDVVYSTSTLSPGQNQEIIQSFIVNYSKNMNFALINLKPLYNLLTSCFSKLGIKVIPIHLPLFINNENSMKKELPMDTCHGLLIIPSISCNYGPTFIAKFRRLC